MKVALSPEKYEALKWRLYSESGGRCADCGEAFSFHELEFHHAIGRGIGGSVRHDLDPRNRMVCRKCHPKADKHRDSKFKEIPDEQI